MPKNKRNKSVKILLLQRLTISMILNSQIKYANKYSCKHDQWMLGFRNQVVDSFIFFLLWNCIFLFSKLSFFIPILRITTQRHQNIFIINIHNIQADCRLISHGHYILILAAENILSVPERKLVLDPKVKTIKVLKLSTLAAGEFLKDSKKKYCHSSGSHLEYHQHNSTSEKSTSEGSSQKLLKMIKKLRLWAKIKKLKRCIAWLGDSYHLGKFVFPHLSAPSDRFSEPQAVSIWSITSLLFQRIPPYSESNSAMFYVKILVTCQVVKACKAAQLINEGLSNLSRESQSQRCAIQTIRLWCATGTSTPLYLWLQDFFPSKFYMQHL